MEIHRVRAWCLPVKLVLVILVLPSHTANACNGRHCVVLSDALW